MRKVNEQGTGNPYIVHGGEVQDGDRYGYKIIAVVYGGGFWAAYRGLTHWSDSRVAEEGQKIPHGIAVYFFPTIDTVISSYNN